jgi:hypothetical protein
MYTDLNNWFSFSLFEQMRGSLKYHDDYGGNV